LLVIDMKRYFNSIVQPIASNVLSLIEFFQADKRKIFFTRHGHRDPKTAGGMLARWWGDLIQYGSEEWELIDEVHVQASGTIIDKNRYSAFFGTNLDVLLRNAGIEDLIITGVLTNCCCETTARDAFMRDYRVFFVTDATAAPSEDLHIATLKNLAYGFAYIVSTRDLCNKLNK
jgi:isochorismate hydrolase